MKSCDILLLGESMERKKIKSDFININTEEKSYFGGTADLLDFDLALKDFSKTQSSGFFALTDLLLYEFAKYSETKGTNGDLNFDFDSYSKFLRNYIDSKAYRYFGFLSLRSIEAYIKRLAAKRRIEIKTSYHANFISQNIFIKIIDQALEKDHPLLMELGIRQGFDYPKYSLVIGREDDSLILASRGEKKVEKISNIFSYSDYRLGLLYIEAYL